MNTLDVLVAARAEVEKGWCKRHAEDPKGNVCAMGAIGRVLGCADDNELAYPYFFLLANAAGMGVRSFNDAPSTTKADVLGLYDRAIAAEAGKTSSDPAHVHALA